jgi:hypothetical protein
MVPAPQSPAIDRGDNNVCPTTDQRGFPRPSGAACDIGAVEGSDGSLFPIVTMRFEPGTNVIGATSRVHFDILNPSSTLLADIAFTDALPTGLVVAATMPERLAECPSGRLLATNGGTRISVAGISLGASQTCGFSIDVRGLVDGQFTNIIQNVATAQTGLGRIDSSARFVIKGLPRVITGGGTATGSKSVRVTGSVFPNGSPTDYWFEFGTNTIEEAKTRRSTLPPATTWLLLTNELTALQAAQYSYRLVASNEIGLTAGLTQTVSLASIGGGSALSFNGTNAFLATPELTSFFPDGSFTIELWFRAERPGVLIDELGQTPPTPGWQDSQFEIVPPNTLRARVWNLPVLVVGAVQFASWHHGTLRYDRSVGQLDGFLDGIRAPTSVPGDRSAPANAGYRQFWAFGLGTSVHLGSGAFFRGAVDEIRIWSKARSTSDIQINMNRRLSGREPGLVCYWRLDEVTGDLVMDATGHGLNGTFNDNLTWIASDIPLGDWLQLTPLAGRQIKLQLIGLPGLTYQLDATTNWDQWLPLHTNASQPNGSMEFIDETAPQHPVRFYRATLP